MRSLDCISSTPTGTGIAIVETEFEVPYFAKRIISLIPFVSVSHLIVNEFPVVRYGIFRQHTIFRKRLVRFESPSIPFPKYNRVLAQRHQDETAVCELIKIAVDIPVKGKEHLTITRQNQMPYCCSPIAGLEIEYET